MKICKNCGEEKTDCEFYKANNSKDGFTRRCKTCITNARSKTKKGRKSREDYYVSLAYQSY